jgi:phosphocarrier protein
VEQTAGNRVTSPARADERWFEVERRMGESAITRDVVIRNRLGLHARASAQFVKTAGRFRAEITVEAGAHGVNGKSIMGLLLLAAAQGTTLKLRAVGADASAALDALSALVEGLFGEAE